MDQVNVTRNETSNATGVEDQEWTQLVMFRLRTAVLLLIVIMAVLGNLLVIVSVMRHRLVNLNNGMYLLSSKMSKNA